MKRNKQASAEMWARYADAEDRAISYLVDGGRFPPEVAIAIATRVEFLLAVAWEDLQEEMRARRDPREVKQISLSHMHQIRHAFASTSPGLSDAAAEQHVFDLLREFTPDRAWYIASIVRRTVASWWPESVS
jgi:hypothetical protein